MIEVPADALRAHQSTNDLGQYTMAADRQCGGLADLLDPWQAGKARRTLDECARLAEAALAAPDAAPARAAVARSPATRPAIDP